MERTGNSFRQVAKRVSRVLLILALAVVAVAYVSFRRDLGAARGRLARIPTRIYSSKYGDIEYLLVGQGPTVLISHGVTGGVDQGLSLTDEFGTFPKGCRFLYVSRFGYLRSSIPANASSRLQAAAYRELADHLGIDKVFVFGNSGGGPSAMWFAVDYPERTKGLILLSSAVPGARIASTPPLVFRYDFAYWLAVKMLPGTLIRIFVPEGFLLTREEKDFLVANVFEHALPISERSEGIMFDNRISTPTVGEIPFERITAPTLILHAADDPAPPIEGARQVARRIPNSRLVVLDGGHFLLRHGPEILSRTGEFVNKYD
ncbi:MAG: alpha/beta hydrolase [Acidobacteriota bacterium]